MTVLLNSESYQGLMMSDFKSIEFKDDKLILIDQTKLPLEEIYIISDDYERIAVSIERLEVRGAPAIGITAAYGLALGVKNNSADKYQIIYDRLARTRPTAVNLFWALERLDKIYKSNIDTPHLYELLLNEAKKAGVKKFIYVSAFNADKLTHLKMCHAKELFVQELK